MGNVLSVRQMHKNATVHATYAVIDLNKRLKEVAKGLSRIVEDANCPRPSKADLHEFEEFFKTTSTKLTELETVLTRIARS